MTIEEGLGGKKKRKKQVMRGNRKSKGPKVGIYLACSRESKVGSGADH